jgi:hypothetical protein
MKRNMSVQAGLSVLAALSSIVACVGGTDGGSTSGDLPSEAFTKGVEIGVPSSKVDGPLPEGDPNGPTVIPLPNQTDAPLMVAPGESFNLTVPYQGGTVSAINIGFGGSQHFNVPVPQGAGKTSGQVIVPARVGAGVCANLGAICHQIRCYEQAGTPFGKTANQQIVLNCTGGKDCNGNVVSDGGLTNPCNELGALYDRNTAACCAKEMVPCDEGVFAQRCNVAFPAASPACQTEWVALTACVRTGGVPATCDFVFPNCQAAYDKYTAACGK